MMDSGLVIFSIVANLHVNNLIGNTVNRIKTLSDQDLRVYTVVFHNIS